MRGVDDRLALLSESLRACWLCCRNLLGMNDRGWAVLCHSALLAVLGDSLALSERGDLRRNDVLRDRPRGHLLDKSGCLVHGWASLCYGLAW